MMRWIVESSLKFRRLVMAVAAGMLVLGVIRLGKTPADVLPEFKQPTVEVQTEALGLSAEEVEQLITVPLEQEMLNGVAFLDRIESASLPGLSSVVMTFEPGTDVLDARQVVQERLTHAVGAAGLSQVAKPPQMLQPLSSTSRVSMIRLSSTELSPIDMSVLARWVIVPRLLGVEGVANVAIWGQRERQLQVLVDPERLRDRGVRLLDVVRTAGNALEVSPLSFLEASTPGTGGFIDTLNQRLQIFHEQAITTAEELEQVTLEDAQGKAMFVDSAPLTLGDVTEVIEDHQPLIGDALCSDGRCLLLVVEKFPGTNIIDVTEGIEGALDALRPGLGNMHIDSSVYRPATFIEDSFIDFAKALLFGAILLLLALGAFFWSWRTTAIAAVVIALSSVGAGLVLVARGTTVNFMVLAGLVMALGALVHDALYDVENLSRTVSQYRSSGRGLPVWRVMGEACLEMRSALFFGALIVAAMLVPSFYLDGTAGAFLPTIAVSYLLAVAVSTGIALTVTPALGMMLLANAPPPSRRSPVVGWLHRAYEEVSRRVVHRTGPALAALALLTVVGLVAIPLLELSLSPALKERDLLLHLEAPPGTSLPKVHSITSQAVQELGSIPEIRNIGAHVGRAVTSDQIVNVNSGEIWLSVEPSADYDPVLRRISETVDAFAELDVDVLTYSQERISDVLAGSDDGLTVRIYGENEDVLRSKAEEIRALLGGIEGVAAPVVGHQPEEPTLEIEVDLARAQAHGVKPGDVHRAAATLLSGITVGNLFQEQKVFDVVVWGAPEIRQSPGDVGKLLIDTPGGEPVPLEQVADVRIAMNPTVIRHEAASSFVDVTADVAGRDVEAVAEDIRQALRRVGFPLDHHAELLDSLPEQRAIRNRALAVVGAAGIGVFLLLQAAFSSWRLAVVMFLSLPAALSGGAIGTLITGGSLGLGSVGGFMAVLGVAAGNAVVLITHYQHLERREGLRFGPDLVRRGTRDRLPAIVMAALATNLALLPLLFGGGGVFEIVRPMAVVVIGGLITSTLLTLLAIPSLYLRYGFTGDTDLRSEDVVVLPEQDRVRG